MARNDSRTMQATCLRKGAKFSTEFHDYVRNTVEFQLSEQWSRIKIFKRVSIVGKLVTHWSFSDVCWPRISHWGHIQAPLVTASYFFADSVTQCLIVWVLKSFFNFLSICFINVAPSHLLSEAEKSPELRTCLDIRRHFRSDSFDTLTLYLNYW